MQEMMRVILTKDVFKTRQSKQTYHQLNTQGQLIVMSVTSTNSETHIELQVPSEESQNHSDSEEQLQEEEPTEQREEGQVEEGQYTPDVQPQQQNQHRPRP